MWWVSVILTNPYLIAISWPAVPVQRGRRPEASAATLMGNQG